MDATTATVAVVNGPEDEILGWHGVGWRPVEESVPRLRRRIFTACLSRMLGNGHVRF